MQAAVLGIRKFALADLELAAYNPRTITPEALKGLRESLTAYGLLEAPVVNVAGGMRRLVSGHQRVRGMIEEGVVYADCLAVDFDEAAELQANLSMNNTAIQGQYDPLRAQPLLDQIRTSLPRPDYAQFDVLRQQVSGAVQRMKALVPEAKPEKQQAPATPKSILGVAYALGEHRLYCGDFQEGMPALFKSAKRAAACVSDPPYNVAYEQASTGDTIQNDDLDAKAWEAFLNAFAKCALKYTKGPCYVFMGVQGMEALASAWALNGGVLHRWLLWAKDNFTLGRGDYHPQHEVVLYGAHGSVDLEAPVTPRVNVLEFPKPKLNAWHPTEKPLDLMRTLVEDAAPEGALIIDPCCGSGTTLIACQHAGRICYAFEIEPRFADAVRRRWAEAVHGPDADWVALTPEVAL